MARRWQAVSHSVAVEVLPGGRYRAWVIGTPIEVTGPMPEWALGNLVAKLSPLGVTVSSHELPWVRVTRAPERNL